MTGFLVYCDAFLVYDDGMVLRESVVEGRARLWADRLGVWASAACVVHCLLTPVVLSMSAVAAHLLPGEERTHRALALLVACLGTLALVSGFQRHRKGRVLLLMLGGLGCIAGGAWFGDRLPSHGWEVAVTFAGSAMMIAAHRMNHTFCRECACAAQCSD